MPCGIGGFVGLSDRDLLKRMMDVQRHRGPDSTGYYVDSSVGLGIDRLSIIDLKKGDQPIHNEDGSVWIVFNGEIYNYVELRQKLEGEGHRFYTDSDTETIVHAYETWGFSCLDQLRGMFAFAIWDSKKKLLFAARDRLGKKPLFYSLVGKELFFSSEMKGILQCPQVPRGIDYDAMDHFFTYGYIPSPMTIFASVRKLPPGHYLVFDCSEVAVTRYWDPTFPGGGADESAAVEKLYQILTEAVRIRLRSDVPLGAFLSGGIDSSVVTSVMSKLSADPIRTVTIGFEEDDSHVVFSRLVANYLGTAHKEYLVKPDSAEVLPKLLWHFDEPFADASFIPTFYLSEAMRKEATVALSGDGGDEVFMGYSFLKDQPIYDLYRSVPKPMRRLGLKLLVSAGRGESKKMAAHALEKDYGDQDFKGRYVLRMAVFTPRSLGRLYSDEFARSHPPTDTLSYLESMMDSCGTNDPLEATAYATFKGYLSEMILTKVDRMSMAVSLEARAPLLDHVLVEYANSLPSGLKYHGDTTKYILKVMALKKNLVPKEVVFRKKVGFGPPVEAWLGKEWGDIADQALDKASRLPILRKSYLSGLLADKKLNASKIFAITIFTLWHSMYVERGGDGSAPLDKLIS